MTTVLFRLWPITEGDGVTKPRKAITATVAAAVGMLIVTGIIMFRHVTSPETGSAPPRPPSASQRTPGSADSGAASLRVDETTPLTAVMNAPEFAGFGELIFPSSERITADMTIAEVARLLPYHSNIDPVEVAATVNDMLADSRDGALSFHPVYTDVEIGADPAKADVGLFFFPGRTGAPFAIIAPGGGFSYVGSIHEGFPYAQAINRHGHHAFVLSYRTGGGGRPAAEDLAAAIDYVFANADTLGVDTDGYSLWGSSAGARMAANLGSFGTAAFGRADRPQPAAVIMAYTGYQATGNDPATFAVVGENDAIAPPGVMRDRIERLDAAGVDTEFHVYPGIGHGFGLGTGTAAEGWADDALAFWDAHRP